MISIPADSGVIELAILSICTMQYLNLISPLTRFYHLPSPFQLESGETLIDVQVAYRTWGHLNAKGDNAVLVCHALTGNADLDEWWEPLLGSKRALDPNVDFVVCSNILGSCYGTTGPTSVNPETGKLYGAQFPAITVRDMVHLQARLLESLGVRSLRLVMGGSLGGMQALEWAVQYPDRVEAMVAIASPGRHSAWCIGLSEAQRQAIYLDPAWQNGNYESDRPPRQGLAVARMMAMSTYRSWASFNHRFGRHLQIRENEPTATPTFAITRYLHHQGQKLVDRFDANAYVTLTHAMDSHHVGVKVPQHSSLTLHNRYENTLRSIRHPALIVAIDSDVLYPPTEQQELAQLIPQAQLRWLHSPHGHDAFLIDMVDLNAMVLAFRRQVSLAQPMHYG